MNKAAGLAVLVSLAILALPTEPWAAGHRSGAKSGTQHHHHRHRRPHAFLFWSPYYAYRATDFRAQTEIQLYCAERAAYYPDATDCPGGWSAAPPK